MKSLCIIILTVFCVSTSYASQLNIFEKEPCRLNFVELNAELAPAEQVRQDLIQGTWKTDEAQVLDWSFQDDGQLFVINKEGNEYVAKQANWKVEYHRAGAILYLNDLSSDKVLRYFVEQTCDGIELENIDKAERLELDFVKGQEKQYKATLKTISGHWEHSLQSKDLAAIPGLQSNQRTLSNRISVSIDLHEDGSFEQKIICGDKGVQKSVFGQWALSPNAKFLIVYAKGGANEIQCLPIQYLEMDELVLTQILPGDYTIQASKGFYFNKS